MNLTYSCIMCIVIILCLFFGTSHVFCQSGDDHDIPQSYASWLKSVGVRESSKSIDYLVRAESVNLQRFKVLRKLDRDWFIVRANLTVDSKSGHTGLHVVNGLWKLSDTRLLYQKEEQWLTLKLNHTSVMSLLEYDSIELLTEPFVRVYVDQRQLAKLIEHPEVLYIGRESRIASPESRVLDLNLIYNLVHKVQKQYPNLKGSDITVGIKEDRLDIDDVDLIGRVSIAEEASEVKSLHATEMATIVGGAGLTFINGLGAAPRVNMVSSGFGNLMPESYSFYDSYGITIQNHSYGGELESFYGASAEAYDRSANDKPQLLHVMSSGNSGSEAPGSGPYSGLTGWANFTGNYKNAKNNIVVGAVDTTGTLTPFSSVGPTLDGRIKPELVAYSTAGTSNAASLVSGASVLLQQAYQDTFMKNAPSSLIKAFLINGAHDVGEVGPDFKTGFGNLNAAASMESLVNEYFYQGTINADETIEIPIALPDHVTQFKVTLVWNDPAASANDQVTLVNDIDLKLIDPDARVWLPWVLDHSSSVSALSALATRSVDILNNVEQITVDNPGSGDYIIKVVGDKLSEAGQSFSVVYDFQLKDVFEWNYPLANSFMPYDGETGSYFRWESTFQELRGQLSLSLDDGENWLVLDDDVDLTKGSWRWLPDIQNGQAIARMKIGTVDFETEKFVINQTLTVKSGFDCADSAMIVWPQVPNIAAYELQSLKGQKLTTRKNVEDTFAILNGNSKKSEQWRIVPKFEDGTQAIGSYLFSPQDLGTDCYISSFYGFREEEGVKLNGNITSQYQLSSAYFEQLDGAQFEPVHSIETPRSNLLEYLDSMPSEGVNYYRLRLELENGVSITSDTLRVYYLNEMVAMIYPNPSRTGEPISIRTNARNGTMSHIQIYDYQGNLLLESSVTELEFVRMSASLSPGIYHYRVRNESGQSTGKLVVY